MSYRVSDLVKIKQIRTLLKGSKLTSIDISPFHEKKNNFNESREITLLLIFLNILQGQNKKNIADIDLSLIDVNVSYYFNPQRLSHILLTEFIEIVFRHSASNFYREAQDPARVQLPKKGQKQGASKKGIIKNIGYSPFRGNAH